MARRKKATKVVACQDGLVVIEPGLPLPHCINSLNPSEKSRFKILVHNCFLMGSVIMIDANPKVV